MSDLADHAGIPCPAHEALAFALARDLGKKPTQDDEDRLQRMAERLPRGVLPLLQLDAVAGLLAGPLAPCADGPLLLPAASRGGGHPAGAIVAAAVVAARAGYGVDLVGFADRLFVAHPRVATRVVDPTRGLRDARELGVDLRWRCGHESAACVLGRVVARSEREGDLATSLAGAALRLALPLDDRSRERDEREHRRLLARLN